MSRADLAYIRRMVVVFFVCMLCVNLVMVAAMVLAKPGAAISEEGKATLGQVLAQAGSENRAGLTGSWGELLYSMVPVSIAGAMAQDHYPQLLFIAVMFGLLIGIVPMKATAQLLELMDVVFQLFQQAIQWSAYAFPLAVLGIMAREVARTGTEILFALSTVVVLTAVVTFMIMAASTFAISYALRISIAEQFRALRRMLMFAFGTSDIMVTMPLIMDSLHRGLGLPRRTVNLVVPLGVLLARYSFVMIGAFALLFTAQLYDVPISMSSIVLMIFATLFLAFVTAGMPTTPYLTALTLVGAPLGLPMEAVIPIFVAIMPILDPMITASSAHLQCAATVFVVNGNRLGHRHAISEKTA